MRILFVGTSSNAGKTLISALFCRFLRSKMIMAAPFKGFNMSGTSFITDSKEEMGIGQALQAWACDIRPNAKMNPVLKKVEDKKLKLFINGIECDEKEFSKKRQLECALRSYDELSEMYDAVVCEGSGSPAELNLRDEDIANLGLADARKIPMILIGDIEKGGVFAGIYGTWLLMNDDERQLMKGFVINKYRGDKHILKSGIERIEELTGMKCFGVLPHFNVKLPEEDVCADGRSAYSDDEIDSFVAELDALLDNIPLHLDLEGILKAAAE